MKKAKFYGKIVIGTGRIPVIPHLYFPTFLDENNPNERMTGIEMGLELMIPVMRCMYSDSTSRKV